MPKNELGTAERYFDFAVKAMGPVVSAESAIVLGESRGNHASGQRGHGRHKHQSEHKPMSGAQSCLDGVVLGRHGEPKQAPRG